MKVSGSIIQAWQRCKRAFYFRSPEYGLGFTTAHDNNAIRMGNWGHYCLGLVLKGATYEEAIMATISHQHKLWQQLNVEPPEDYVELETRFSNLMYAHKLWQQADKSAYRSSNLEVLQAEQRWEIEHRGITITGQWDAIVRLKDEGSVFVLERKVTKHPDRMLESAQWDIQPRLYVWAAQQLFPEDTVVGVIYEFIRNTDPTTVKILKNGYPSRAKAELQGTTYQVYLDILRKTAAAKKDDFVKVLNEYRDALDELDRLGNPVFRRQTMHVPKEHQQQAVDTAWNIGNQIKAYNYYSPDRYEPSLSRYMCNSPFSPCSYRDVCLAMDDGADWLAMLEYEFVQDKPHFDEGIDNEIIDKN